MVKAAMACVTGCNFAAQFVSITAYRSWPECLASYSHRRSVSFPCISGATPLLCSWFSPSRSHDSFHAHSSSMSQRTLCLASVPGPQSIESGIEGGGQEEKIVVGLNENVQAQTGFQLLGNKEKKELRAYAHKLGTRLNVQQVGKSGVSQTVVTSISDALEANEILKVKVLENCSSDMSEVILQLEHGTGGQVVGKIGRTVLLYRASRRKLANSEKQPGRIKHRSMTSKSPVRETRDSQRARR